MTKSNIISRVELFGRERIAVETGAVGLPEIPALGRINYKRTLDPISLHTHSGGLEVTYLAKGQQIYCVGGKEYRLTGGDIIIMYPDEKHGSGVYPEEKSISYWVVVDMAGGKGSFLGLQPDKAREIRRALANIEPRHFKGGKEIAAILDDVLVAIHNNSKPHRLLYIQNKLVDFLLKVVEYGNGHSLKPAPHSCKAALDYIDMHPGEKPHIKELAVRCGLSVPNFKALFKRTEGIPPAEYVLRKKIEQARAFLLKGDKRVTDIAYDLGFSSSQYFATVFKRFTGERPRRYKRNFTSQLLKSALPDKTPQKKR